MRFTHSSKDLRLAEGDEFWCQDCESWHLVNLKGGTGYAILRPAEDGLVCYPCATRRELADLRRADTVTAYVSGDGKSITNWPGGQLMRIDSMTPRRRPFGRRGRYFTVRATDQDGAKWIGAGEGPGVYINMRRKRLPTEKECYD